MLKGVAADDVRPSLRINLSYMSAHDACKKQQDCKDLKDRRGR
jgi:hypothetical protein